MTRIDFAFGAGDRLRAACQTARKRYLAGQRMVVYCSDGRRLSAFDRMLWAFDDISFVPHVLANDPLAPDTPVVLTAADPALALARRPAAPDASAPDASAPGASTPEAPAPDAPETWLLNLDDACPPNYDGFARLLEFVSDDPADRQAARQRWRTYQAAGHPLQSHDLTRAAGA
ncbi:DNA polymerase III subunit chi [Bordetella genomosp. 13]|uniref:DNA polymerase III subunit chi n=1 Tax=Bordetella genomosp. 13 TaxID=463040 RepID=UPI0011A5DA80|nr:DNA polymerase III subunit chi [Bordetella genomosp. 13]